MKILVNTSCVLTQDLDDGPTRMFRNTSMSVVGALRRASVVRRKAAADDDSASVSEHQGKNVRVSYRPLYKECCELCAAQMCAWKAGIIVSLCV